MRRHYLLGVLHLLLSAALMGQGNQNTIESASLTAFPPPNFYLEIQFTNSLASPASDLVASNLSITVAPVGATPPIAVGDVSLLPQTKRAARIVFSSALPTPPLTGGKVCFQHLSFIQDDGSTHTVSNLCGAVQLLSPANVLSQKASILKALQTVPKTTSEKNVFASGLVTSASSSTQGGLNLDLNSNQLGVPGMTAFLRANKTSVAGGDPKSLEVGANFRYVYLFKKKDLQQIRDDVATLTNYPNSTAASSDINDREKAIQRNILSALLIDFAGKVEGEPTSFQVANYVADLQVSAQSRTKTLFGSRNGFWQFRLVPLGFDVGKNIQNTMSNTASNTSPSASTSNSENVVGRYKGGVDMHL